MELSALLASDAALVIYSTLGLAATGLAIARDIPVQRRVAELRSDDRFGASAYRIQDGRGS